MRSSVSKLCRRLPHSAAASATVPHSHSLSRRWVVTKITSIADFESKVVSLDSAKLKVVDYKADWCGPCKRISPLFEQLSDEYDDQAEFYQVDCDEVPELAGQRGVSSLPTFEFIRDGYSLDQLIGANPAKLEEFLQKHLA